MKTKFIFPYYLPSNEHQYWKLYSQEFLDHFFIKNLNYDKIVFFHPEEPDKIIYDKEFFSNLKETLNKHSVELELWIGNYETKLDSCVINWPSIWIYYSYFFYQSCHLKVIPNKFDKGYVFLNRRSRLHRSLMIDKLYQCNLQDFGHISWHGINKDSFGTLNNYQFKFFNNSIKTFDDLVSTKEENTRFGFCINFQEYFSGFVNLISESEYQIKDISEKTWFSILHRKPFMILGVKGVHRILEDMGFELYNEIFDYSFDFEDDLNTRIDMIAANLQKLQHIDLDQTYQKILPKIEYNRNVLMNIIKNKLLIPEKFYQYLSTETGSNKYYLNLYNEKINAVR